MSAKSEVFEYLDENIEKTESEINYFEKFGNERDCEGLMKQAIKIERLQVLKEIKNTLTYIIRW